MVKRWPGAKNASASPSVKTTVMTARAQGRNGIGHAARARRQLAVGVAMNVAFDAAGDDLLVAVVALRVGQKGRDQQRLLHHGTEHVATP